MGRPVVVWGGGTVGLMTAPFARPPGAEAIPTEPSPSRREIAARLGFEAPPGEEVRAKARRCRRRDEGPGVDTMLRTGAWPEGLDMAPKGLRSEGTLIVLGFPQGRLGAAFPTTGLAIRCARIGRRVRGVAALWDRPRAQETLALLRAEGAALRRRLVSPGTPFDTGAEVLRRLPAERPDFPRMVFAR